MQIALTAAGKLRGQASALALLLQGVDDTDRLHQQSRKPACQRRRQQEKVHTCSFILSPNAEVATSMKQSMREAMDALLARYRLMRPLLRAYRRSGKCE